MTTTPATTIVTVPAPLAAVETVPEAMMGLAILCGPAYGLPWPVAVDYHETLKPIVRVRPEDLVAWLTWFDIPMPVWTTEAAFDRNLLATWPEDVWANSFVELHCTKPIVCDQIHEPCLEVGCERVVCPVECEGFHQLACSHGAPLCVDHIYAFCAECRAEGKAGEHA